MKVPSQHRHHNTTTYTSHGTQGKYVGLRKQNSLKRNAAIRRSGSASALPAHPDSGDEKGKHEEKKK